jgi:hypothetical protein
MFYTNACSLVKGELDVESVYPRHFGAREAIAPFSHSAGAYTTTYGAPTTRPSQRLP